MDAIALAHEGQAAFEVIEGVRVFRIQKRRIDETGQISYLLKLLMFFFRSAWVLTLKHIREPYDLIHVHSVPDFEVFATLIPRLLGARVILDIHDVVPEFYASKFKVDENSLLFRLLVSIEKLSIAFSSHTIIANDLWLERVSSALAVQRNALQLPTSPICPFSGVVHGQLLPMETSSCVIQGHSTHTKGLTWQFRPYLSYAIRLQA